MNWKKYLKERRPKYIIGVDIGENPFYQHFIDQIQRQQAMIREHLIVPPEQLTELRHMQKFSNN